MIIEKLNIKAFGRLRDYELELSPGVNIIEGENESGKSTLCAFIKFIFYGIPAKERAAYASWSDSRADGSLTFSVDGTATASSGRLSRTASGSPSASRCK